MYYFVSKWTEKVNEEKLAMFYIITHTFPIQFWKHWVRISTKFPLSLCKYLNLLEQWRVNFLGVDPPPQMICLIYYKMQWRNILNIKANKHILIILRIFIGTDSFFSAQKVFESLSQLCFVLKKIEQAIKSNFLKH